MERNDRPAVRGLRPGTDEERTHARAMHALHSVRAHLGAAREAYTVALASAAEARNAVDHLGAKWGDEHYGVASILAELIRQDVKTDGRRIFTDSLETAKQVTILLDTLGDLQSARWS